MRCAIVGYEFKCLEIKLAPGEEFYGERGSFVYCGDEIDKQHELIGGSVGNVIMGKLSGESLLLINYRNVSNSNKKLVLAGSRANIIPFKMEEKDTLYVRSGAYVASSTKVKIGMQFSMKRLLAGMSLKMQSITGVGTVFVDGVGLPIIIDLKPNESIEVDENHILAFLNISESQISSGWSMSNVIRGEGLSTMKIKGPGKVYLSPI